MILTITHAAGYLWLLFALLLGLKLGDAIAWSWLWVATPLWLPGAAAAAVMALVWLTIWRVR